MHTLETTFELKGDDILVRLNQHLAADYEGWIVGWTGNSFPLVVPVS
jgi:hypothetical protein